MTTSAQTQSDGTAGFAPQRGRPTAQQAEAIARTILAAATHLFLAHGFEATSMDAVAVRAGVPKSTLYKRFADKRVLLRAVIDTRVATWSATTAADDARLTDDLAQRLTHYARWVMTWACSHEVRAISDLAASAWPSAAETQVRQDIIGFNRLVALIERDIRRFGPRAAIHARDPHVVAVALMALLSGWLNFHAPHTPEAESAATDFATTAVELLIGGSGAW